MSIIIIPKMSPNWDYKNDCSKVVFTMNSFLAFMEFHYQDRKPYILNSDNHIPKMFMHNLLNCPILIIRSVMSPEMTEQPVQLMWACLFNELRKRTAADISVGSDKADRAMKEIGRNGGQVALVRGVLSRCGHLSRLAVVCNQEAPIFIDFTETHPTIIAKLCSALQCVVSFSMTGYSATFDKYFILKTIREAFIVVTPMCSHLPPATILSLDCAKMQEHVDWRPLLRYETKELTYFSAKAELMFEHFANLFQPNLDKVTIFKRVDNKTKFDRGASMLKSMISMFHQLFDRCLRARTIANAKQMEVDFVGNAVRGEILQNPSIQRTLVALHCCTWNPITFKITFGDGVTMETLIDDTPGSDEKYHIDPIVKQSLAQKVYCCNLR